MNDPIDEHVRRLIEDYNEPRPAARSRIWRRIEETRHPSASRRWGVDLRRFLWPSLATAALLFGVFLGTRSDDAPVPTSLDSGTQSPLSVLEQSPVWDEEATRATYRFAMTQYLSRTEAFLTRFRHAPEHSKAQREVSQWAGRLLGESRLLLDSPAAEDPELRTLLEDLELVLAQIVQLDPARADEDRARIGRGLEDQALLMRLRVHIPAGTLEFGI